MNKFFTGSIAAIAIAATAPAFGADMAARYSKAPAPAPVMVYNWTGCYIGGNVGGRFTRFEERQIAKVGGVPVVPPPGGDFGVGESTDFIGGGQIGCDFQVGGNWVVGIQGMYDYGNTRNTHVIPAFPTFFMEDRVRDMVTLTGRVGYLFAPQVLAYVKGGGAWARTGHTAFGTVPALFTSEFSGGLDRSGWTVGGGLEWMFAPGWSVFGEYNYMDFGRRDIAFTAAPGTFGAADIVSTRLTVSQALAGVNYKFNWGGPVVARY